MGWKLCFPAVLAIVMLTFGAELANSKKLPESLARILYMLNGDFYKEVETTDDEGNIAVSYIQKSYIPIDVPGNELPTILIRGPDTGDLNFILELYQDHSGFIHMPVYGLNKTVGDESVKHVPAKLPEGAELITVEGCRALVSEIVYGTFVGYRIDCLRKVDGMFPAYILEVTCDHSQVVIDADGEAYAVSFDWLADEKQSARYAWVPRILNGMKGTQDPCSNS